jgi:hypothetical protein
MLALVLADLVDGDDVRMLQVGCCLGLRVEPLDIRFGTGAARSQFGNRCIP